MRERGLWSTGDMASPPCSRLSHQLGPLCLASCALTECPNSLGPPWVGVSSDPTGCGRETLMGRAFICLCVRSLLRAPGAVVTTPPCWLRSMYVRRFSLPWGCPPSLSQSGAGQLQAGQLGGFNESDPRCSSLGLFPIDVVMSCSSGPQTFHGGRVTDIHRVWYCSSRPTRGGPLPVLFPLVGLVSGSIGVQDLA